MAIEHKDITEPNLHEPKGVSVAAADKVYVTDGAGSGEFRDLVTPTTLPADLRKVYVADGAGGGSWKMPLRMGFWDYNDLSTASSPISLSSTPVQLTNDGLGTFTNSTYKLPEIEDVWDVSSNAFDFTGLKKGDIIDMRLDVEITTTGANHDILMDIQLGIGGFPYQLPVFNRAIKTASTTQGVFMFSIYIGDDNTLNNPGHIRMQSDSGTSDTVKINGWFLEVTSRGED